MFVPGELPFASQWILRPWRLATMTLLMVFTIELTVMMLLPDALGDSMGTWGVAAADSFVLTALLAPCIWIFMVRPLQTVAESRKEFLEWAIRTEERKAGGISRDLHDNFGQLLTAINIGLRTIEEIATEKEVASLAGRLRTTGQELHEQVRALARVLRPAALDDLGLAAAVENLAHDLTRIADVSIKLDVDSLRARRLPHDVETAVYRVCQEAISNSIKHGKAKTVSIRCRLDESKLKLSIEDDGTGFSMGELATRKTHERPFGLISMKERIKSVGGKSSVHSSIGKGVLIEAEIDLSPVASGPSRIVGKSSLSKSI